MAEPKAALSKRESERVAPVVSRIYEVMAELRRLGYQESADRLQFEAVAVRHSAKATDQRIGWL